MAANKVLERYSQITLLMPTGVNLASGQPVLFGEAGTGNSHYGVGVLQEAQNTSLPPYDPNTGYLSVDFEGAYNLTVEATTSPSPSAGAAIKTGDAIFASGGTYDPVSGITYGFTLCKDTTAPFFGLAMQPLAAGTTAVIPVLLKNAC
jgi:hypothetical protein